LLAKQLAKGYLSPAPYRGGFPAAGSRLAAAIRRHD